MCLFLLPAPSRALESQDTQLFITGFNAYQKKDYKVAAEKMSQVLKSYPDTQLRDMAIFWLARASYKAGDKDTAARYMAQFFREYPENPLKTTVEDELVTLASAYAKSDKAGLEAKNAEAERAAAQKAAADKALAEESRRAADIAAAAKLAQEKVDSERAAAEKGAAEKARADRIAREKAETERLAKEAAIAEERRLAQEKEAAEKAAQDKQERERIAAEKAADEKAEIERRALERAEAKRLAKEKAEQERIRLAAEKSESEKAARENAERERLKAEKLASDKAEAERLAKLKAESEKVAQEKAELDQKRAAAEKAAAAKTAAEAAERERLLAKKAEDERLARDKELEAQNRLAAEKAAVEQRRIATSKKAASRSAAKKTKPARVAETARDQAIAEYRRVIDSSPASSAAEAASAKLKAMGVDYPPTGKVAKAVPASQPPVTTQVLTLEVGQFVDVEFNVDTAGQVFPVGRRINMPFEVINRGNGEDSFYLESGFPAEYGVQFFANANTDTPVNLTPQLAPGQRFNGVMGITIPKGVIDGQKISFPVKLASKFARDVSQSRQVTLIASAPLLRAVINTDRKEIAPGEKVTYRVTLLNIGSAAASGVLLRMNYPPLYEPVDSIKSGFKQEMKAALLLDGLKLESGESKELSVTFQLKDEAIARQELFLRGDLINNDLETSDSFVSAVSLVQGISGVAARSTSDRLIVIPGQTVTIPLIVTNTGNQREDFPIRPNIPANVAYTLYQDLNRDGIRQSNDPVINHIGPLSPREEAYVILELKTSANENDGASAPLSITFEPEGDRKKSAAVNIKLAYSRPLVELSMTGRGGRLRPGEVATFDLTCTNRGSSIAKVVEMRSLLPDALELVASDPAVTRGKGGENIWKFEELGAGEKKGARVSIRVKSGVAVGTNLQVKNLLSYQDQLGNSY
nr:tetratricopeptide repeat protein [Geoanaerobacter pelophilus]